MRVRASDRRRSRAKNPSRAGVPCFGRATTIDAFGSAGVSPPATGDALSSVKWSSKF